MNTSSKLAMAAFAGLMGVAMATSGCTQQPSSATTSAKAANAEATKVAAADKHACKGQNACAGQGGDGKNACKGQGSCATDGSTPPANTTANVPSPASATPPAKTN